MTKFKSVWDAIEDDPVKKENLKIRSHLMIEINEQIDAGRATQMELAKVLETTQPRVSALRKSKINEFRLDMLVDFAIRLGLRVSLDVAV
ncbi:MAG: XRE family transcriptional regulator [Enterobacterales bacterium]|nr:XRE family transcriptional regulator [Enterobacterales bacterium]